MFAPTSNSGKFLPPQNRFALCVSTLRLGLERRCRFNSPISLSSDILFLSAFDTTICTLSAYAEWGSASNSDRALPCTHNGFHPLTLTRDVSLDLLLASLGALFLLYACNLLWSAMLIPHSSLLIPHFSFLIPPLLTKNPPPHLAIYLKMCYHYLYKGSYPWKNSFP